MIKNILFVILICLLFDSVGQTMKEKDSLINVMCKQLNELKQLDDSTRLSKIFTDHYIPYLNNFHELSRPAIDKSIFLRFQHQCKEFHEIVMKNYDGNQDWQRIDSRPGPTLTTSELKEFKKHEEFWYHETTGDTVNLELRNGFWIDHFKDTSYSKLSLEWIDHYQFEISFIESNNRIRKSLSKPGDRYRYTILDCNSSYYTLMVEIVGHDQLMTFRLYPKK